MQHHHITRLLSAAALGAGLMLATALPALAQDTIITTEGDTFPATQCTSDGAGDVLDGVDDEREGDGSDAIEPMGEHYGPDDREENGTDGTDGKVDFPELQASEPDDDGTADSEGSPDQTDGSADETDGHVDRWESTDPDDEGPDQAESGEGSAKNGHLDFPEHNGPKSGDDDDNREGSLDEKDGAVDRPEHQTSGQPDDDGTKDPEGAPDLTDGEADELDGAEDETDGAADQAETDGSDTFENEDCQTGDTDPGNGDGDGNGNGNGTDPGNGDGNGDGNGNGNGQNQTPPAGQPDFVDLDCADFPLQDGTTAQAMLDQDSTDPHLLDADSDGQACEAGGDEQTEPCDNAGLVHESGDWVWNCEEWVPVTEDTDDGAAPTGGIETGGGGVAGYLAATGSGNVLGWLAGGLAAVTIGAGVAFGGPRLLRWMR